MVGGGGGGNVCNVCRVGEERKKNGTFSGITSWKCPQRDIFLPPLPVKGSYLRILIYTLNFIMWYYYDTFRDKEVKKVLHQ